MAFKFESTPFPIGPGVGQGGLALVVVQGLQCGVRRDPVASKELERCAMLGAVHIAGAVKGDARRHAEPARLVADQPGLLSGVSQ